MNNPQNRAIALLLLTCSGVASAVTVESCHQAICASIELPDYVELGAAVTLNINGRFADGSNAYSAYQVLKNVNWSYTSSHMVALSPRPTPEQKIGGSGFNFGSAEKSYTITAEAGDRITFIFGSRSSQHGYYDLAVEAVIDTPNRVSLAAIDIKPGSCVNPFNIGLKGVLPVAILGSETLDVTQIDPASVRLLGVPALRHSLEDVSTIGLAGEPPIPGVVCETGGDGYPDLTLKFDAQAIAAALKAVVAPRSLTDGDRISLPLSASHIGSGSTDLEASDKVKVIIKGKK